MVTPDWYFSTLAQAVAASIGFVIAFVASLYTSRRSRMRERVKEFDNEVSKFHSEVRDPLENLRWQVKEATNSDLLSLPLREDSIGAQKEAIQRWVNEQEAEDYAAILAYLTWAINRLESIQESTAVDDRKEQLEEIDTAIALLNQELETGGNELLADIDSDELEDEISTYLQQKNPVYESISGHQKILSFITMIYFDLQRIENQDLLFETESVQDSFTPVIQRCKLLFATGVVIPMGFLLVDTPFIPNFPTWAILILEVILLSAVGVVGWGLFDTLQRMIKRDDIYL